MFAQARAAQATQAAAGAAQSLGGAAIGLTAALGTAGLLGAFALLGMGAAKLTEQLKEANEVSKGTITSTTAFAREFGMSRSEARKFAIENEIRVERLGASLPISSSDINAYAGIMNNSGIAATLGGDRSAYQRLIIGDERSAGTATRFALLRQSLGNRVNDAQATSAAGLLAGGGTRLKDLNIEFFKASGLYEQLKKENFDSLQGVARIEAVNRALANLVPDAAIAEMQGQIDAMVSSVNDRLFSPRTGLFGALRPLQNLGGKSLYEEVSRSLGEGASVMSKGGFGALS